MKISKRMTLSVVAIVILTSIVVYSADAAGIPKKAISTVSRFIESDLPTTTLFTDVANTITAIQQFTTTSAVFENPAHTFGTTLAGGAVTANRTLNLPAITGTDTVATLGLTQTFTGSQTINSLILGGDENVGSNALTNTGHKSTLPLTTGQLLQINGSAAGLTNNVRGVSAGTGISVNGSTGTVQVTNAGVTSATGTSRNVTVSASTGAVTWNLGDNVVTTGGSAQTITKPLKINALNDSSAIVDANAGNKKITFLNSGMTSSVTTTIRNNATSSEGINIPATRQTETFAIKPAINFTAQTNRTGTNSLSGVMLGPGTAITPQVTGRVQVYVTAFGTTSTAADGCRIKIYYGSGTEPINGAAVTGTNVGGSNIVMISATTGRESMAIDAQITGLTLGTRYWIQLDESAVTGGTCTINNVNWSVFEL